MMEYVYSSGRGSDFAATLLAPRVPRGVACAGWGSETRRSSPSAHLPLPLLYHFPLQQTACPDSTATEQVVTTAHPRQQAPPPKQTSMSPAALQAQTRTNCDGARLPARL